VKYVRVVGRPSADAAALEFVGAVSDVTERRRAEEVRAAERMRIARDLHDTLLQSFQGLLLLFHAARERLPADPSAGKDALDHALERAQGAVIEGRDAVQDLRHSTEEDLSVAMRAIGAELAAREAEVGGASPAAFLVVAEGAPHTPPSAVRYEIYRIAF